MKNLILLFIFFSPTTFALEVSEAKEILKPFKMELMKTLQGEMKAHGAQSAVKVCNTQAMPITEKHAKSHGKKVLGLGRTSHKLRNEKNQPKEWVKEYLTKFQKGELKAPIVVKLEKGVSGYLEPIKVNGACLKCHGENLAPKVSESLKNLYPQDKATGFKAGDFRGLFWLEVQD